MPVFNADETSSLYKEVGKWTYIANDGSADESVTEGSREPDLLFPLGAIALANSAYTAAS